jgi:hypothetical protein
MTQFALTFRHEKLTKETRRKSLNSGLPQKKTRPHDWLRYWIDMVSEIELALINLALTGAGAVGADSAHSVFRVGRASLNNILWPGST